MANTVNEDNTKVKLVFTSLKGTKIFTLVDITEISAFRGVAAETAQRYAKMNVTEKELKALISSYKANVNNQDLVKAHSIIQEIDYRLEMICETNSLFDLAAIYFFIEGEDADMPNEIINAKKKELFDAEPDLKAFFLLASMSLTKRFSEQQGKDLLSYLEETKHLAERIYRYIAKRS